MKIALCLHGLVGNIVGKSSEHNVGIDTVLRIAHQHWDRYFLEPYNPDVFIHTWNVKQEKQITNFFNPKVIKVQRQKKFNIPEWIPGGDARKHAHYSKWYSNQQSVNLMLDYQKENNIKYDLVMIARFDIAWRKKIEFEKLNNKYFYIGGWIRNPESKVKDFWFISNPENIRKFSTIYDKIEYFCTPEVNALSKSNGISNHKMAAKHLLNLKFKVRPLLYCANDLDGDQSDYPLIRYYYFGAEQ